MAQIKILLPLLALALSGCTSISQRQQSAVELAANPTRVSSSTIQCTGAQRTKVCTRNGPCHCSDSGTLFQSLGLDDPAWLAR